MEARSPNASQPVLALLAAALLSLLVLSLLQGCKSNLQEANTDSTGESVQVRSGVITKPLDKDIQKKIGKPVSASTGASGSKIILGDLSGDGKISEADGKTAMQLSVGKQKPTPQQLTAGDFNHDGQINVSEVTALHQAITNRK